MKPFRESDFVRRPGPRGFNNNQASLQAGWYGPSVYGVPVTTTRPNAPIQELRASMRNPGLMANKTFAVRLQPQRILAPRAASGTAPVVELMAVDTASGTQLYLRPTTSSRLELGAADFHLVNDIRQYTAP